MNIGSQYIENLYIQFTLLGFNEFYDDVLEKAREKMLTCHGVDLELLHLSYSVLEKARVIDEISESERWRDLAALLRRAAQKIYRECTIKSNHPNFLRLV
jgi:hypothetical protein